MYSANRPQSLTSFWAVSSMARKHATEGISVQAAATRLVIVDMVDSPVAGCSAGRTSKPAPARHAAAIWCNVTDVTLNGIERLRNAFREMVRAEGLRPLAARTGIPVGQIRSLIDGRAVRVTTLESMTSVLGVPLTIGPGPGGDRSPAPPGGGHTPSDRSSTILSKVGAAPSEATAATSRRNSATGPGLSGTWQTGWRQRRTRCYGWCRAGIQQRTHGSWFMRRVRLARVRR